MLDDAWDAVKAATPPNLRVKLRSLESAARALNVAGSLTSSVSNGHTSEFAAGGQAGVRTSLETANGYRALINLYDLVTKDAVAAGTGTDDASLYAMMAAWLIPCLHTGSDISELMLPATAAPQGVAW